MTIVAGPILLAEDNAVNQRIATAMLERLGFRVDVVADGIEAVNAAAATTYQVILMDCQLPQMDGFQAAAEIRRWRGASRRTPIIAVTAANGETDQQRCLSAGMNGYLAKPITQRGLAEVLTRWAPEATVDPPIALEPDLELLATDALDAAVVERLERLGEAAGEDLMGQLIILYLASADDRVVELRSALAAHDASATHRAAHSLTGASANIGALRLSRLCAALSLSGEADDLINGEALLEAVEAELVCVRSTLIARGATS
jgi:two-component system, sensor histidine kinase and response regulator